MSESMPITASTAPPPSQGKEAVNTDTNGTADTESADGSGGFTKLMKAQLKSAKQDSESGNDSPSDAATPANQVSPTNPAMIPLAIFQIQNNAVSNPQVAEQATAIKSLAAATSAGGDVTDSAALNLKANTGVNANANASANTNTNPDANANDSLNMDEVLTTRQQQQLMQSVMNNKSSLPPIGPLLKQKGGATDVVNPPSLPASSAHNSLNMASLSTGDVTKTDVMPGQSPPALNVPSQHPGWNQAVGDRLQWMVGHHIQSADIRLDPPELGRLDVHIQLHKDHASVVFTAPNQQVRDALESAVPRLREMMGNIGLSLGDVNVSQHSFSQGQQANENARSTNIMANNETENDRLEAIAPITPRRGIGMLDAYA